MFIFKFEAQGDCVYVQAQNEADARKQFSEKIGEVPAKLLKVSVVNEIPEGEEFL